MNATKVDDHWVINSRFINGVRHFNSGVFILPTIAFSLWNRAVRNIKRYPIGSYEASTQIVVYWLFWEFSITFSKKNYRYNDI